MSNKFVSVIMTAYNAEKYIYDAINSILRQTYNNFELIIVNDGSDDKTDKIINSFSDNRIYYLKVNHIGRGAALNLAVSNSKGEFIAIMDADDIAFKNRIEVQINYLDNHSNIDIVGSYALFTVEHSNRKGILTKPKLHDIIYRNLFALNSIIFPTTIFRKNVFNNNLFNEKLELGEDIEFFQRTLVFHKSANIGQSLMVLRQRKNSRSRQIDGNKLLKFVLITEANAKRFLQEGSNNEKFIHFFHIGCIHYYYGKIVNAKGYFIIAFGLKKNLFLFFRYLLPTFLINENCLKKLRRNNGVIKITAFLRKIQNLLA